MRGQVSIEYLIIIAVALGVLIPGVLFFYAYNQEGTGTTTNSRINDIGLQIITTVKSTYAVGNGAWQTVEFTMPDTVTRVYVNNTELIFVYDTPQGPSEAVFFSPINMTASSPDGNISSTHGGSTRYRITSRGQTIFINETT
jgi:hypothetical protein